jgi:DNA-binding Lrp family transcriptional regulator
MPGPKPDIKLDAKIAEYRAKGLSFQAIAKIVGLAVNNVWRRYKRWERSQKSYPQEGA